MNALFVFWLGSKVVSNRFFNYLYRMKRFVLCFRLITMLVLSVVIVGSRVGAVRASGSEYACLMWQDEYGSGVYDTDTGVWQESRLVAADSPEAKSYWMPLESPDGRWVAFYWGTDQAAFITFVSRLNQQRLVIPVSVPDPSIYGWSADSSYFALDEIDQQSNHTLVILAIPSLKEVFSEQWNPVTGHSKDDHISELFVKWSNTGHQLAFMHYDNGSGQVRVTVVSPIDTSTSYVLSNSVVDNSADYLAKEEVIITWSPDDQQISLEADNLADDLQLSVYDIRTAQIHRITDHNQLNTSYILWAAQGHSLFYLDSVEMDTASVEVYQDGQSKLVKGASFDTELAPDKKHFILGSFSNNLLTYAGLDVDTLRQTTLVTTDRLDAPVWLDNDYVAITFTDGLAWGNINGTDWHQNHEFHLLDNNIADVNRQAIAFGDDRSDGTYIGVVNRHTQETHFFRVASIWTQVSATSLSPDGKTLAVVEHENSGFQFELFATDGKWNKKIPINTDDPDDPRYINPGLLWSPDSLRLLVNSQLIDINSGNIQIRSIDAAAVPGVTWIKCDSSGAVF